MNQKQISAWLKKCKPLFPIIATTIGVSVPTLYSMADNPGKKRQARILLALTNYIQSQSRVKK